jgi:DNA-binding NtrC family response regulator
MTITADPVVRETALLVTAPDGRQELEGLLGSLGYQAVLPDDRDAIKSLGESASLCLIDLRGGGEAIRATRAFRAAHPDGIAIGVADPGKPSATIDAIHAGIFDVLPRPPSRRDLEALLRNAREQAAFAAAQAGQQPNGKMAFGVIGASPAMLAVMDLVRRAAPGRCGLLICGERGTGRETIARAVHSMGANQGAPFIKVDCSSLAPEDFESALFGVIYKRTTAATPERRRLERVGRGSWIAEANGGILFLENLADLPARIQARLVRVLRDREVFFKDARTATPVDVRPIAAVDQSIDTAVSEGRIRPDLYDRLSLVRIEVPSLRQRRDDIPLLATHFLKELCLASGKPVKTLTRSAVTLLTALPWHGNARELRALLERLILLVPSGLIRLEDILAQTQLEGRIEAFGLNATLRQARARFERDYIAAVLQHHRGRIPEAARALGIQRTNLYRKIRGLNLMRPRPSTRQ